MCRWIAYQGEPIYLEELVAEPSHSLIAQSLCAAEAKVATNGDGFGLGWYGDRDRPGVYREIRPAWSDENLRHLCHQVRSSLFFAHVRASTGPAIARANCHPFAVGRHMFMHNGQVGAYCTIRRHIEALIPDDIYPFRSGTTDSEALFLASFAFGLKEDPIAAVMTTLDRVAALTERAGGVEALRFTAALTDGQDLYAFRWSTDGKAPTLYWRADAGRLVIVSEPLDGDHRAWQEVPQNCVLVARAGRPPALTALDAPAAVAA